MTFRRPTSTRIRLVVLSLCVSLLAGACGGGLEDPGKPADEVDVTLSETLVSADGLFQMKVPGSWKQESNLNEAAILQAADRGREAYALLIIDPKKPFEGTALGRFADTQVQKFLESVSDSKLSGPDLVIIDGNEALQYEIEGKAGDVDVTYLYTFMESDDSFLKAVTWSLADNYRSNKKALAAVTESIRQLKALEESPSPAPAASPGAELSPGISPSPEPPPSPAATPSILERPV
jgi:hypothetical protein